MKRVVITGIGIVSCIGNNKAEVLDSLLNTKSGIVFSEEHKKYNFRSHVIGSVVPIFFIHPILGRRLLTLIHDYYKLLRKKVVKVFIPNVITFWAFFKS